MRQLTYKSMRQLTSKSTINYLFDLGKYPSHMTRPPLLPSTMTKSLWPLTVVTVNDSNKKDCGGWIKYVKTAC